MHWRDKLLSVGVIFLIIAFQANGQSTIESVSDKNERRISSQTPRVA